MVLERIFAHRQDERDERRARAQVSAWMKELGLPSLEELDLIPVEDSQQPALRHVTDVLLNFRCTDPDCPWRNDEIPDFIRRVA